MDGSSEHLMIIDKRLFQSIRVKQTLNYSMKLAHSLRRSLASVE